MSHLDHVTSFVIGLFRLPFKKSVGQGKGGKNVFLDLQRQLRCQVEGRNSVHVCIIPINLFMPLAACISFTATYNGAFVRRKICLCRKQPVSCIHIQTKCKRLNSNARSFLKNKLPKKPVR
jgi:hypothetical protein